MAAANVVRLPRMCRGKTGMDKLNCVWKVGEQLRKPLPRPQLPARPSGVPPAPPRPPRAAPIPPPPPVNASMPSRVAPAHPFVQPQYAPPAPHSQYRQPSYAQAGMRTRARAPRTRTRAPTGGHNIAQAAKMFGWRGNVQMDPRKGYAYRQLFEEQSKSNWIKIGIVLGLGVFSAIIIGVIFYYATMSEEVEKKEEDVVAANDVVDESDMVVEDEEPAPVAAEPETENPLLKYEVIQGKRSPGNDIKKFDGKTPEELAKICNDLANCKGFMSHGWVKRKILPEAERPNSKNTLYIKK